MRKGERVYNYFELFSDPILGIVVRANRKKKPDYFDTLYENDFDPIDNPEWWQSAMSKWYRQLETIELASDHERFLIHKKIRTHCSLTAYSLGLQNGIPLTSVEIRNGKAYFKDE